MFLQHRSAVMRRKRYVAYFGTLSSDGKIFEVQEGLRRIASIRGARNRSATDGSGCSAVVGRITKGRLRLGLLVPEDRQRKQRNGDNPENNVFTAVLFFCHRGTKAYLKTFLKDRIASVERRRFTARMPSCG